MRNSIYSTYIEKRYVIEKRYNTTYILNNIGLR